MVKRRSFFVGQNALIKRFEDTSSNDNVFDNQVWCVCGMPEEYGDMICCRRCEQWFHKVCIGAEMSMDMSWKCTICKEKQIFVSKSI